MKDTQTEAELRARIERLEILLVAIVEHDVLRWQNVATELATEVITGPASYSEYEQLSTRIDRIIQHLESRP